MWLRLRDTGVKVYIAIIIEGPLENCHCQYLPELCLWYSAGTGLEQVKDGLQPDIALDFHVIKTLL